MGDLVIDHCTVIFVIVCLNNKSIFDKTLSKPDVPFFNYLHSGAKSVKWYVDPKGGRLVAYSRPVRCNSTHSLSKTR